jgi:hypothetical protein
VIEESPLTTKPSFRIYCRTIRRTPDWRIGQNLNSDKLVGARSGFEFVTATSALVSDYIIPHQRYRGIMSYRPNRQKNRNPQSSEDAQGSPISKETAGAVAGAAIGSVAGPIGAVVGGVVGALAGKPGASGRPVRRVAKRRLKRYPKKQPHAASRKTSVRSRTKSAKAKKTPQSPRPKARKPKVSTSRARRKGRARRVKRR